MTPATPSVYEVVRSAVAEADGDRDAALAAVLEWARTLDTATRAAVLEQLAPLIELPPEVLAAGERAVAAGASSRADLERHLAELADTRENPVSGAELIAAYRRALGHALLQVVSTEAAFYRCRRMKFEP